MKDGCISKLTVIETGHRATQYKNIIDTLPILYADKNYRGIDDVLCNGIDLVKADFTPSYLDTNRWSNTYNVEITTVNRTAALSADGSHALIIMLERQTHVFNAKLQEELLSELDQRSKIRSQDFLKFVADKKALMTIIFGKCDKATKIEIALGATYNADHHAGNLIKFLKRVHTVYFGSNNGGLLFGPYKQVRAMKLMNNYSNNKLYDPHGFKEEVKIKYDTVKTVAGRFPNRTIVTMELIGAVLPPIYWAGYSQLTPAKQLTWEVRGDNIIKPMLFLMNSKNDNAKKDLRLSYSQGNMTAYPPTIKSMARYLSTQYPNKNSANQRKGKKEDRSGKKENDLKSEDKDSNTADTAGIYVEVTTPSEESTASSRKASIGAHVLEANEHSSRPTCSVEEILGIHLMNHDDF